MCNAILFNPERPTRGKTFVTRKVVQAIARIALDLQHCLYRGKPGALRNRGHAGGHVEMQWLTLQQTRAEDFVIASGQKFSARQFVERDLGVAAKVEGPRAKRKAGDLIVRVDPRDFRPTEIEMLQGDPTRAHEKRGWTPRPSFEELGREMTECDHATAWRDSIIRLAGFTACNRHE